MFWIWIFYQRWRDGCQTRDRWASVSSREMFKAGFAKANMVCIVENIFQDGEWAILEWRDPKGLRGCGFFHIVDDKILFQRGYWDKLSFLKLYGLPLPEDSGSKA
jgi:hypothetical protein